MSTKTMTLDEFVASIIGKCVIRTFGKLYGQCDYCRKTQEEIINWEDCMKCQGIDPKEVDFDA